MEGQDFNNKFGNKGETQLVLVGEYCVLNREKHKKNTLYTPGMQTCITFVVKGDDGNTFGCAHCDNKNSAEYAVKQVIDLFNKHDIGIESVKLYGGDYYGDKPSSPIADVVIKNFNNFGIKCDHPKIEHRFNNENEIGNKDKESEQFYYYVKVNCDNGNIEVGKSLGSEFLDSIKYYANDLEQIQRGLNRCNSWFRPTTMDISDTVYEQFPNEPQKMPQYYKTQLQQNYSSNPQVQQQQNGSFLNRLCCRRNNQQQQQQQQ